ncbi:hypothetical protein FHY15_003628 [Xanthomonas arboricola]|nr:hypothetical protein [Xanthomonas arboricola]
MSATVLPFPSTRVVRQLPPRSRSRVDLLVEALERLAADPSSPFARRRMQLRAQANAMATSERDAR